MKFNSITNKRGSAAIEFVWSSILLVIILLFTFQIFRVTMYNSAGLIRAQRLAFSSLDTPAAGGQESIIDSDSVTGLSDFGVSLTCPGGDCRFPNYNYQEPPVTYPYGISSFSMGINKNLVVYLDKLL